MVTLKGLIHEIHRRSLWQVLTIYLVGSWIGYQVIIALTQGIGLPAWVPGFAIVLFLIGLPIVLATAFVQEGVPAAPARAAPAGGGMRAAARRHATAHPVAAGRSGPGPDAASEASGGAWRRDHWLLTWPRALAGGLLAFLLLGATTGGYMGLRAAGIGPFGTLIARGELADRERVLISEFQASPGDEDLARALTQAFRVDIAQSGVLRVLEPAQAREILERMGEDATRPLTPELTRELALRDGIKAYIAGDVLRAGRGYSLTASLVAAGDGAVLTTFRETAADSTAVLDAIGRLSRRMRERIGESLRTVNATRRLESVTTPSLEALRKYSEAVHALDIELDSRLGMALLQEAIALDSTFGMAWRKLAVAYSNLAIGRDRVIDAATKAYHYRDRMTPRERDHATAFYHMHVTQDYDAAIAAYRAVLQLHPDDQAANNNIAIVYGWQQRYDLALEHQQRSIELFPHQPRGYTNLAFAYHRLARVDDSERILESYRQRFGETRELLFERVHLAVSRTEYDSAAVLAGRLRELNPADARNRADAAHVLADLAALRGRLAEEDRHRAVAVAAETERGAVALPLESQIWRAERHLDVLGDADAALRQLDAALERHPLASLPAVERPYGQLITLYARLGRTDRARALIAEYEAAVPVEQRGDENRAKLRREAAMAFGSGDFQETLRVMRMLEPLEPCARCMARFKAFVFDHAQQPDSAIAHYERFVTAPHQRRLWTDAYQLAPTHERLAELYEMRGDRERAAAHAARFVELWRDADPLLQPRVAAKQALLADLRERR
jgi:eukaryotic-like serine/threonine-protein kinase